MIIAKKPKRYTRDEAILTSRALNESERKAENNPDERWWFEPRGYEDGHYEILVTNSAGEEIAHW